MVTNEFRLVGEVKRSLTNLGDKRYGFDLYVFGSGKVMLSCKDNTYEMELQKGNVVAVSGFVAIKNRGNFSKYCLMVEDVLMTYRAPIDVKFDISEDLKKGNL